jgi:hypothetical protein
MQGSALHPLENFLKEVFKTFKNLQKGRFILFPVVLLKVFGKPRNPFYKKGFGWGSRGKAPCVPFLDQGAKPLALPAS